MVVGVVSAQLTAGYDCNNNNNEYNNKKMRKIAANMRNKIEKNKKK